MAACRPREKEPGDLEVFAYTSEVLLFADVEAPANLPPQPITIQAKIGLAGLSESVCSGARAAFSHFKRGR